MEKFNLEMALISQCDVVNCTFNINKSCQAKAITVGDGSFPGCDTYLNLNIHCREKDHPAGVGACKVANCAHNDDFECIAQSVSVGVVGKKVQCLSFEQYKLT